MKPEQYEYIYKRVRRHLMMDIEKYSEEWNDRKETRNLKSEFGVGMIAGRLNEASDILRWFKELEDEQ
ncbi:MAG: hypothetical protein IKY19_06495 [Bacteroidaceae bacterium]|nr:hypothetical protein [Bacteroidaceae bacterium]